MFAISFFCHHIPAKSRRRRAHPSPPPNLRLMASFLLANGFVSRICSILFAGQKKSRCIEEQLDRMKDQLLLVQSAVRAADKRHIIDDDLNNWLTELKDIEHRGREVLNSFKAASDSTTSSSRPPFLHLLGKSPEASRRISDDQVNQLHATLEALETKASRLHSFLMLIDMDSSLPPDDCNPLHRQLYPAQTEISGLLESDSSYSEPAVEIADADESVSRKKSEILQPDSSEWAASADGCSSKRKGTVMLRHAPCYSDTPAAHQIANSRASKIRRILHHPAKGSAGLASTSAAAAALELDESGATS